MKHKGLIKVLQELGIELHKSRLEFLAMLMMGIIESRTVNLKTVVTRMQSWRLISSNYRRAQRFFAAIELDNVVFRMGIAPTRAAARQLVSHRHITVDGEIVNIPSYSLKPGQIIGIRQKSHSLETIENALANRKGEYEWLTWDTAKMQGTFVTVPERLQIPEKIEEHLIVELYSK